MKPENYKRTGFKEYSLSEIREMYGVQEKIHSQGLDKIEDPER